MLLLELVGVANLLISGYFNELIEEFNALGGMQELGSIIFRLILACALGAVFGFEREIKNKLTNQGYKIPNHLIPMKAQKDFIDKTYSTIKRISIISICFLKYG